MLKFIPDVLASLLYPQACGVCGHSVESSADGVACRNCWEKTKIFSDTDVLCQKCGRYFEGAARHLNADCPHCSGDGYDTARAVGIYENALAATILHLKRVPSVSRTAQRSLIRCFENHLSDRVDVLVPVPLSAKRLVERGYNQAAVLARIVSRHAGAELDEHTLIRKVHTPMHRVAMDRKAREVTVKNAFAVTRPKLIEGKNVLLIDDVLTSGSTVSNCALVLKKNGAARVDVLTLARAV